MRIGINTRFLLSGKMEGFGWYTFEIAKRLVENHPEHEFVFFFDRKYDEKFIFGKNVTPVILFPPARHPFLFITWFEFSIKRALKKYKIDVFFSPDGYLCLGSDIPQIATIHDLNFEHNPLDLPRLTKWYYRKYFPLFAKKAKHIITVSDYSKQDIINQYQIPESKITTIWNAASDTFKPLSEVEQEVIRSKYSNGQRYFLFVGAIHPRKNVHSLIEAFIQFKKQTHAPIKLLIVGESLWKRQEYKLESDEKFKDEIIFTGHLSLSELSEVMASAFALTYVPYFEGFGIPLVEAMKCGTPILSGNLTALPEVAGDAALYCNPLDVNDISAEMTELVSNENLRNQLKEAGLNRSELFSWDRAAEKVWEIIKKNT